MEVTHSSDTEIDQIISEGQVPPDLRGPIRPVMLLSGLAVFLLWLCFTPIQLAPAAWIALLPFCILLRAPRLSGRQYRYVWCCGLLWGLATVQWLRLGHPAMYLALLALGFYLSLYFPVFLYVSRRLLQSGIPVWLAVPLVWTSLDFLRAWLMTGFAWYFLGHSQYRWLELIQIADITGVYGITFLIAMSAAVVAEFLPDARWSGPDFPLPRLTSVRSRSIGAILCATLLIASVGYGWQRQTPLEVSEGPVISLVQGNFAPTEKHDRGRAQEIVHMHDLLTTRAAQLQPDLIVWPETMWPVTNWQESPELSEQQITQMVGALPEVPPADSEAALSWYRSLNTRENLLNRSQECGAPILFGVVTQEASPRGLLSYNSAAFLHPQRGYLGRYDKMHCVIFGEYTPLKSVFPFLSGLRPPGMPELESGRGPQSFESAGVHYAPAICFEDTVPRVIRSIVNDSTPSPDVLVNMTNDGWFHGSSGLDQHLITSLFRCIETRRPMVRAVNGGISALIDSSGRIRDPDSFLLLTSMDGLAGTFEPRDSMIDPETGHWYRNCSGVWTGQLPLDGRNTIYLKYGDWFAMLCAATSLALFVRSFVNRRSHGAVG